MNWEAGSGLGGGGAAGEARGRGVGRQGIPFGRQGVQVGSKVSDWASQQRKGSCRHRWPGPPPPHELYSLLRKGIALAKGSETVRSGPLLFSLKAYVIDRPGVSSLWLAGCAATCQDGSCIFFGHARPRVATSSRRTQSRPQQPRHSEPGPQTNAI